MTLKEVNAARHLFNILQDCRNLRAVYTPVLPERDQLLGIRFRNTWALPLPRQKSRSNWSQPSSRGYTESARSAAHHRAYCRWSPNFLLCTLLPPSGAWLPMEAGLLRPVHCQSWLDWRLPMPVIISVVPQWPHSSQDYLTVFRLAVSIVQQIPGPWFSLGILMPVSCFRFFPKPDGKRALCQDMVRGLLSAAQAVGPCSTWFYTIG